MFVATYIYRIISTISPRARFLEVSETVEEEVNDRTNRTSFRIRFKESLFYLIPFADWIRRYPWREYFLRDFVSGLTVSVLLVPQGLAYAQLADCPPVVGLYMATFPCFIYGILSSSKHVSYGPMALICLMTDTIITHVKSKEAYKDLPRIEVGTAVTFTVGLWFILMFLLRLERISSLLSKTFISSFTTGVSVHVFTSQVKEFLGIELKKHYEVFGIVNVYIEVVERIYETNIMACGIGVFAMVLLYLYGAFMKPILLKRGVSLPMEFFVMATIGFISYLTNLEKHFKLRIVGHVPKGFPLPNVPRMELITEIIFDSFILSVVSYFITESIVLFYAGTRKYKVDPQQDFFAQGTATLVGSFLECLPLAGSISRSAVQERVGGETQLASVIAASIMTLVLLYVGDYLEPIPRSVLAAIIMISFFDIFKNATNDLKLIWFISKQEFFLWFVTFFAVVLVGPAFGLVCGLFISFMIHVIHSSDPQIHLIGRVHVMEDHYVYVPLRQEIGSEVSGVKIIQINGPVNLITRDHVQRRVYELSGVNPAEMTRTMEESLKNQVNGSAMIEEPHLVPFKQGNPLSEDYSTASVAMERLQFMVLDVTFSTHVDASGLAALEAVGRAFEAVGVGVAVVARDARVSPLRHLPSVVQQLEAALKESASRRDGPSGAPRPTPAASVAQRRRPK